MVPSILRAGGSLDIYPLGEISAMYFGFESFSRSPKVFFFILSPLLVSDSNIFKYL